jgi:Tfp pilus assembly protein PilF
MRINGSKLYLTLATGFAVSGPFSFAGFSAQAAVRSLCCSPLEQISTHLELLTLYLKQGDATAARKALFNAQTLLELHAPEVASQPIYWAQVASAHSVLGQFEPAFEIYQSLYALEPGGASALRLGQLALQLRRMEEAQRWLMLAHRLYTLADFPAVLALNLWEAGLYPAAVLRFKTLETQALARKLSAQVLAENRLRLADIYLQASAASSSTFSGSAADARDLLDRTRIALISTDLQPLLASVFLRLQQFDAAATVYQKLLQAEPQNPAYLLALANSLVAQQPSAEGSRIRLLFEQAFDLLNTQDGVADASWRNVGFGLAAQGDIRRAEQAFLKLTNPGSADFLQAAFLAQQRGELPLAQERFRQVLRILPVLPDHAEALQQRWQAEWALWQSEAQMLTNAQAFRAHQNRAGDRWKAVFAQNLLQSTPEGRLLLIESALALDTPEILSQAETLVEISPEPSLALRHAELALRQRPEAAPVLYEQLLQAFLKQRGSLSVAEQADLARGLTAVQKYQGAERVWKELLADSAEPLVLLEAPEYAIRRQWQLERLHNQWQIPRLTAQRQQQIRDAFVKDITQAPDDEPLPLTLLRRAQLALSLGDYTQARTDFSRVLKSMPGNLVARQGWALSLQGLQRYGLAHEALKDLQRWSIPQAPLFRDAHLRLAQIEQMWGYRSLPEQRARWLMSPDSSDSERAFPDGLAFQAAELQASLHDSRWTSSPPQLNPNTLAAGHDLAYTGQLKGRLQDFFIGNAYTRYGILDTSHTLSWIHPQKTDGRLTPALAQQLTVEAERYQILGESDWFSFQRGGVRWQQHWRHESNTGPLHYWFTPALAYRLGLPEPLSIGVNQHGHAQLETGVQLDTHQAFQWDADIKFGQAEVFLGGFYNYGSVLRWRWREPLVSPWGDAFGVWGVELMTGVQNYLVLDGNGGQQNLFRQLNGIDVVYQTRSWDYIGKFDVSPIYGSLSDINLNTTHVLQQELSADWGLEYRLEAHHYNQPVQRYQNQWRAQAGVVHHFQTPLQQPLSLAFGIGFNHFYSAELMPAPQLYFSLSTER